MSDADVASLDAWPGNGMSLTNRGILDVLGSSVAMRSATHVSRREVQAHRSRIQFAMSSFLPRRQRLPLA